jgi:hypothetical protein
MGRGNSCTRLLQFLFQLYNRIDFFFFPPPFSLLHVFIICFSVGGGWGGSLNPPAKLHPTFPCALSWLINTQREDLCGQTNTHGTIKGEVIHGTRRNITSICLVGWLASKQLKLLGSSLFWGPSRLMMMMKALPAKWYARTRCVFTQPHTTMGYYVIDDLFRPCVGAHGSARSVFQESWKSGRKIIIPPKKILQINVDSVWHIRFYSNSISRKNLIFFFFNLN